MTSGRTGRIHRTCRIRRTCWARLAFVGFSLGVLAVADCAPHPEDQPIRGASAAGTPTAAAGGRGSFLLVTLDTTRPDHLEPYGASAAQTPTLARLAREGIVFERAYAVTPLTLPSHASILTGLYPPAHGVRNNGSHYLTGEAVTLAEILSGRGFRTAAFLSAAVLDQRYGLDQGFEVYDDDMASGKPRQLRLNAERPAAETVTAAGAWLDALAGEERFFLWLHLFDPHADYAPPAPWSERFRAHPYDGEIAYLDAELGRLLAHPRLAEEDCLVMVLGDHGEGLGEHGESTHAMLAYESTLRVPWLVRLPARAAAGGGARARLAHPVSQVDLLPTALDLLGVEDTLDGEIDGRSQVPAIIAGTEPPDGGQRPLYAETLAARYTYGWAELRAVVAGRYKLIDAPGVPSGPELFDLEADPGELESLAAREPERVAELRRALAQLARVGAGERLERSAAVDPDPEMRRKLASLGYLASSAAAPTGGERPDPKALIALHEAIERARHLLHRRELEAAGRELLGVLERDPDNLAATVSLAKIRAAEGRFEEGIRLARRALELAPDDPDLHTSLGLLEAGRGELAAALAAFDAALALDPRWLDARIEKARCLYRLGRREEAEALVGRLLADEADVARVQVAQAELVEIPGRRFAAATARLRRAAQREPSLAEAWRALGRALEGAGEPEAALDAYRRGLDEQPNDGALHARLGLVLSRLRRDGEAEEHLRRAVELIPEGSPPVLSALSAILLRRRDWAAAAAEASRALELDPGFAGAWVHLAIAREEDGRIDDALAAYDRARELDPASWEADLNQALLLRKLGRFADAAGSLRRVLELSPDHAGAHFELGILYAGPLADLDRARVHFRASLDAAPGHPRESQVREILRQLGDG